MADQKVSDLPSLSGADVDAADLLYIIDSSAGSAGSKKITVGQYQLAPVSGGTANGVVYLNASKVLTTGSDLVFDGSNLGLGVTPSAWGGGFRALQIYGRSSIASDNANRLWLNSDCYNNGTNWIYGASGVQVSQYQAWNGQHAWYTAPSGTAGNAISFTQAMTLDANGSLLLGTTTYSRRLTVGVPNAATLGANDDGVSVVNASGRVTLTLTGSTYSYLGIPADSGLVYSVSRLALAADSSTPITFHTSSAERARITSGGDLLVGTTTVVGAGGLTLFNNGSTGFSLVNNNNAAPTGYVFSSYRRSSTEIGSITQNGTTAVLFNTTSDRRLKDNIVPAPSASAVIDAIEIVSHDWKAAPDEHVTYGVIAQDLALVAPQAVLQGDDGDEIEKTWGVDYSKLVPMLIKEIQSLRARVAALESA